MSPPGRPPIRMAVISRFAIMRRSVLSLTLRYSAAYSNVSSRSSSSAFMWRRTLALAISGIKFLSVILGGNLGATVRDTSTVH
jgi:hypothetical protein